ncbi:HAD family hydrolase [Brevibacterium sp. CS2]|uniref:HAD family hydrolase n=1 Tax=Brevibacterium sp. CS2 TaxID=2575923 RepID=UPI0010C78012|nr:MULTISPECIES: HAD-IA family hydrolase [Actinomycetes]MCX0276178.1 HAD family hydrolase [Nocardia zapadnayensis]QCP05347.1 HAD family hydrolase [Brevibacterium sp. CS2]
MNSVHTVPAPAPGPALTAQDTATAGTAPAAQAVVAPSAPAALVQPRALLLDFGGVVVSTTAREDWAQTLADTVLHLAAGAGFDLDRDLVEQSLRTGRSALSLWKNASSRRQEPRELAPGEIVEDFLLSDLPGPARRALALDAARILAAKSRAVSDHHVRPGIPELLSLARERGIGLGIVSNAHAGGAHREILREKGLDGCFGVQVYSDEVGIRKPHPGMIRLAAEALGAAPHETWYVGDTVDRDVVAGRRAGAGRVIITRDRRTDHPPFSVADTPDLVLDTPAGLLDELRRSVPAGTWENSTAEAARSDAAEAARSDAAGPVSAVVGSADPTSTGSRPGPRRVALLLDHGGVLTTSVANPDRDAVMGQALVELSQRCGHPITLEAASAAMRDGWERHRARKRSRDVLTDPAHRFDEVDPAVLWGDLVGADLPEPVRAAMRLEAAELSYLLHRTKGTPSPREGALELVRWAHAQGIVVGIVSNTISGRGVRATLADYGILDLLGPGAYSDEVGVRKPGTAVFAAALSGLQVEPADVVYVGDKALNDGRGGRDAGIGTVCLLRGGKDADAALDEALAQGWADHVLDGPADVIDVLGARLAPDSEPLPA